MMSIFPFEALRPAAQHARQVASKPYDVLSTREAKTEAEGNPYSFLHVTRSEIDLAPDTDVHGPEVYAKAKENLDAFVGRSILFIESKPCYYIYRLTMNGNSQTGIVCCSAVSDYDRGLIKKHEFTRPDKEADRIAHIRATGAQTGNVFLAFRDVPALHHITEKWKQEKTPVYDFTTEDQVQHTVWVVNDGKVIQEITALFSEKVDCTYIADGHNRAASAAKVKAALPGNPGAARFLTTLFPASELHIMDYNRVVRDLNGLSEHQFLEKITRNFSLDRVDAPCRPGHAHQFGMYLGGQWFKLAALEGSYSTDPVGVLDVSILQDNLLEPVLGIRDQRTDTRIDFIGGIRGMEELEKRVDSGNWAVAFSLFPVSIQQLFDIADTGNVMPPKSTWFEPKLRDGLLTHLIG